MSDIDKSKYIPHTDQQRIDKEEVTGNGKTYFASKYKEEYVNLAFKYALLGATVERMAEFFDVTKDRVYKWQVQYPDFKQAIHEGRELADAEVAHSLYKRATGYVSKETKVNVVEGEVVKTDIEKEIIPEVGAAKYWLGNRQGDKWKTAPEVEANINIYKPIVKRFDGTADTDEESNDS